MNKRMLISPIIGAFSLALLCGCGGSTIVSGDTNPRARVVDCLQSPALIAETVDGNAITGASTFGAVSSYQIYNNGNRTVVFKDGASGQLLATATSLFQLDSYYTCIGYQSANGPAIMFLSDGGNVGSGMSQIRFTKVVAGTNPTVDVYVTLPGVDITTVNPTFSAVTLGANNEPYVAFTAGTYEVRETMSGSKVPFDDQQITLQGGASTTLLDQGSNTYLVLQDK